MRKKCAQRSHLQKRQKETEKFSDMVRKVRTSKILSTLRPECNRTTMKGLCNHGLSLRLGAAIEMKRMTIIYLTTTIQMICKNSVAMREIMRTLS